MAPIPTPPAEPQDSPDTYVGLDSGAADYELRVVTRDMHAFDDFLRDKILSLGLVSNIESRIVIRSVKNTTAAPLGLVSPYVSAQS